MLDLLKTMCMLDAPSGFEDAVRDFVRARAATLDCDITEDVLGNLIVHRKGKPAKKKVMFAAHMDEVGLFVKSITDAGYLKFACLGGIDPRVLIGKRVMVGKTRLPGVIGIKAVHLTTPEERKSVPKITDLYIDIGAKDKAAATELTEPGDYVVFDSEPLEFGDGMIKARAIDDRVGCAAMLLLMERCDVEAWYAFTVQEEVGTRGAGPATYRVQPDVAIILEGTTAGDSPEAAKHLKVCGPGKGAVLPFMDNSAIYDVELFREMCALGDANNIKYQIKQYVSGGTDAGVIQRACEGVRVAAISAAVRYIHSPSCVASIADLDDIYRLAESYIESQRV